MNKKLVIILAVTLVIVVGGLIFLKKGTQVGKVKTESAPKTPVETQKELVRKIKGIGFKEGAWAEYEIKGGGEGKLTVKMFSFDIEGKKIKGLEITHSETGGYVNFWDDAGKFYQGIIYPKMGLMCVGGEIAKEGSFGATQFEFKKSNLEEEYEVDESLEFVGKDKFKTESGKEIEILKFKRKIQTGMEYEEGKEFVVETEFWFSPQVPTYFVYGKDVEGGKLLFEGTLVDFGLEGAKISVSKREIENCIKGEGFPQIPEMPELPELPKFLELPKFSLKEDKRYCQTDADCACGVDKETKKCAIGNKKYIDTSKACPDFCGGIAGHLKIVCKENQCTFELK